MLPWCLGWSWISRFNSSSCLSFSVAGTEGARKPSCCPGSMVIGVTHILKSSSRCKSLWRTNLSMVLSFWDRVLLTFIAKVSLGHGSSYLSLLKARIARMCQHTQMKNNFIKGILCMVKLAAIERELFLSSLSFTTLSKCRTVRYHCRTVTRLSGAVLCKHFEKLWFLVLMPLFTFSTTIGTAAFPVLQAPFNFSNSGFWTLSPLYKVAITFLGMGFSFCEFISQKYEFCCVSQPRSAHCVQFAASLPLAPFLVPFCCCSLMQTRLTCFMYCVMCVYMVSVCDVYIWYVYVCDVCVWYVFMMCISYVHVMCVYGVCV